MNLKEFLWFKKQPSPQDVFNDYLEEFTELARNPAFVKYLEIIEWRIHNLTEQILLNPKEATSITDRVEGMRQILKDFKRILKKYKEKEK